jgi:hypothetical protein
MSTPEKHPHIDAATDAQIAELLQGKTPAMRELYLDTHRLVLETLPDVAYSIDAKDGVTGYGARQYGYSGWGMLALAAHARWVSLMFMRGAELEDSDGLLEGTGKQMRHVKLRSAEHLEQRRDGLRRLIQAAARLNA